MAFSYAITSQTIFGDKRIVIGTFTNAGGSTGGDITLPDMHRVFHVDLTHTGATVVSDVPTVNETMPCSNVVTIVTVADKSGTFIAIGE